MFGKMLTIGALASLAISAPTQEGKLEARQGVPPGNACGPVRRETRLVDDGSPQQWRYEVQLTRGLRCEGAECSISREEVESHEISASFSADGGSWISGEFSVTQSTSTGETNSCPAPDDDRDRVCMWDEIDHTEYTVQDWKTQQTASSCSNWVKDGDEYTITSPNESNKGDVVCKWNDDCESQGANNWIERGSGGPP